MKRKRFLDPVLRFEWHFQIGGTNRQAFEWYCKLYGIALPGDLSDNSSGTFGSNDKWPYSGVIWIKEGYGARTMTHEVAHAVNHVCRVLELDPREADEFYARYTDYLNGQLLDLFYRKKRMPLTKKGKKISKAMNKHYGKKKGKQVFNAMINEGKLKGVEKKK